MKSLICSMVIRLRPPLWPVPNLDDSEAGANPVAAVGRDLVAEPGLVDGDDIAEPVLGEAQGVGVAADDVAVRVNANPVGFAGLGDIDLIGLSES